MNHYIMGFFDSLIGGIHDAASWLHDHAGTIENVVGTVAKVAGSVLLGGEQDGQISDQSPFDMTTFVPLLQKASKVLEKASEETTLALGSGLKAGETDTEPANETVSTTYQTFPGLWAQPTTLDSDGRPPLSMTRDISQMVGLCGFPQSIQGPDGQALDVPGTIGKIIFANAPKSPLSIEADGEEPFTTSTFTIRSKRGDMSIQGAHSYYTIPLGTSAINNAWHGVLHLKTTMTESAANAHRRQVLATSKVTPWKVSTTGANKSWLSAPVFLDVWEVTLRIIWDSGDVAQNLGPKATQLVMASKIVDRVESESILGAIQRIRVWAAEEVPPAAIRETVQNAVNTVISKAQLAASVSDNPEPVGAVTVDVVDATIVGIEQEPTATKVREVNYS